MDARGLLPEALGSSSTVAEAFGPVESDPGSKRSSTTTLPEIEFDDAMLPI